MILPFRFHLPGGYGPAAEVLCNELAGPRLVFANTQATVIRAPLTCAWLLWRELSERGWPVSRIEDPWGPDQPPIGFEPWSPEQAPAGRELLRPLVEEGILREHIASWGRDLLDGMTPYQLSVPAWVDHRPYLLAIWACGAGKTLGTLLPAVLRVWQLFRLYQRMGALPGSIAIVAPAKARRVWRKQVAQYTHLPVCLILPPSEQGPGYQKPEDYYRECLDAKRIAIFMVGSESLPDHWSALQAFDVRVVLYDEIHLLRNHKRWESKKGADGRKGKPTRADNQAAAALSVAELPRVALRIGASATPLGTGRPRALYAPLTLLDVGGLGLYNGQYGAAEPGGFTRRFCDGHETEQGWWDDSGSANLDELAQRTAFYRHEVSHTDSHGMLPPLRWEVVELEQDQLGRGVSRKEIEKAVAGEGVESGPALKMEVSIALCASQKMPVALEDAVEALEQGEKVVSFLPRRLLCERFGVAARQRLDKVGLKQVTVLMGHGGHTQRARDRMAKEYEECPGPIWLVGTGEAWGTSVDGLQCTGFAQILGLPWSPELLEQWKGRFDRQGSKGALVRLYVGPAGTVDSRIIPRLIQEIGVIEQFMRADSLKGASLRLQNREDVDKFQKRIIALALAADTSDVDLPD